MVKIFIGIFYLMICSKKIYATGKKNNEPKKKFNFLVILDMYLSEKGSNRGL